MLDAFIRGPPAAAPARDIAAPTALLRLLAVPHAEMLARAWPAPHAEFLVLPAARRHLAAIACAAPMAPPPAALRRIVESERTAEALRGAIGRPPRGLAGALSRMGETLWPSADYAMLLELLREPQANLVLRHAAAIDGGLLAVLTALPPALRRVRIAALAAKPADAQALADAFVLAQRIHPRWSPVDLVRRLDRAEERRILFKIAQDWLVPGRFVDPPPAPALPMPFRRLAHRGALEQAALRYRNCLGDYVAEAATGRLAFYLWEEDALPGVALALSRDAAGWRLAEALLVDNETPTEDMLRRLIGLLAPHGVRAGPSVGALVDRLETAADRDEPEAPLAAPTLAQLLGLGQLWR